jgi:hypothetical protein
VNSKHLALCGALIVAGVVAIIAGLEGLGVVVAVACPLMMGAMGLMMIRHRPRGR